MTQLHATRRNGVLEQHADDVIKAVAKGESPASVAKRYGVAKSTVTRLLDRHNQIIERIEQRVVKAVEDYAIAQKVTRIADLDMLRRLALEEIEKNGYAWTEETKYGVKRRVSGAVEELRAADHQAAEELGQITPPERGNHEAGGMVIYRERIIEREMRLEPLG